jgi:hypothetical protein
MQGYRETLPKMPHPGLGLYDPLGRELASNALAKRPAFLQVSVIDRQSRSVCAAYAILRGGSLTRAATTSQCSGLAPTLAIWPAYSAC